jgi:LemA protein
MSRGLLILLIALGGLMVMGLVVGMILVSQYNRAIALEVNVETAWAEIDNQLQRRYDLIPNLVETVRGYAAHEQQIFTDIAEARTRYFNAQTPEDRIGASEGVERALSRLLMLQEQYPQLQASQQFRDLMVSLEGTENRISVARSRYNQAVRSLNTFARSFFGRFVVGWAGVSEAPMFEVATAARETPRVDFGTRTQPAPAPQQ